MHGKFFWYDVMTTDTAAAARFYSDVVGWGLQSGGGAPGQDYTIFAVGAEGQAGLMPIPDAAKGSARPVWFSYILVDDVDQAAAAIEKAGGAIHRPAWDVPGVIRIALVADPQGAVFMVAKPYPRQPRTELAPRTPGGIGWHELYTSDWQAAFAFYEQMFGWTKGDAIDMGAHGTYQLFATGEAPVGGMMNNPPQSPGAFWLLYFNVEAIEAATERVKAQGGTIVMGPHQVPGGDWIVQCVDPQGARFALTAATR